MPETDADTKSARLERLKFLYSGKPPRGYTAVELAEQLGCDRRTVLRYIQELDRNGQLPVYLDEHNRYQLVEDGRIAVGDLKLDLRQGMALYLAARLLAQQTDEYNLHVMNALDKLIAAMPREQGEQLRTLVSATAVRHSRGTDVTDIFSALVLGWARRRVVKVTYRPSRPPLSARTFDYRYSPYLFEPSGIARTIYVIGAIAPKGQLRTFKLERIEGAVLTDEVFTVPEGFDGAALLARAWGVMYGDEEPVTVRLRFSKYVARRVKETVWHPSEKITDLSDGGCEWEASIGDVTEIGPWVRGWGRDCEVLAPEELRADVIKHVRHMMRAYGIQRAEGDTSSAGNGKAVTAEDRAALDDIFG